MKSIWGILSQQNIRRGKSQDLFGEASEWAQSGNCTVPEASVGTLRRQTYFPYVSCVRGCFAVSNIIGDLSQGNPQNRRATKSPRYPSGCKNARCLNNFVAFCRKSQVLPLCCFLSVKCWSPKHFSYFWTTYLITLSCYLYLPKNECLDYGISYSHNVERLNGLA